MEELAQRLSRARTDSQAMEQMVTDYLPFIKKQLSHLHGLPLEYEDMLSVAMLTFVGCIRQYDGSRGGFMSFAGVCIRNRLIDEGRKQSGYAAKVVPLVLDESGAGHEADASLTAYNKTEETAALRTEIDALSGELAEFGIGFAELARICPKQQRSRQQCLAIAHFIAQERSLREQLLVQHTLAQAQLAEHFGVSAKTIEKHRKYIVALTLLLLGDYTGIRAFLPHYGR